jgi:hypothetical protein
MGHKRSNRYRKRVVLCELKEKRGVGEGDRLEK